MKEDKIMSFETKLMWMSKGKVSLSFVSGYLTAIIIAPCELSVDEWTERLLKIINRQGSFNLKKNIEFMFELSNFYNLLVDSIKKKRYNSFTKSKNMNDLKKAKDWSDGFLNAVNFWDKFSEMFDDDVIHDCLTSILYLCCPEKIMGAYNIDESKKDKIYEESAAGLNRIIPMLRKRFIHKKLVSKNLGYMSVENKNEMVCA